jgi:hypothetical protein
MEDFAGRYRELPDEEVMELYADREELEPEAQAAVAAEFHARRLNPDDAVALKRSLLLERREIERKQSLVGRLFFGWWFRRPK